MTDPVFALEPDIPRNVRIARWLLFRLLSGIREGALTVREGAQTFHFGDPAAGRLPAFTDRRQPRRRGGLDGRRMGEPAVDAAAADPGA